MFLPTTKEELKQRGWDQCDIILVSGDSYIDSPYIGIAVLGRWLEFHGYRVGIVAQPDIDSDLDIARLGEPKLFWGVTAGSVDSMVANYTALKKRRNTDDFTPGAVNNRRPDRATIVYTNIIRRFFKNTVPIVIGGIEASLRRIAHYDYWSDRLRKSLLFDAKADLLVYGMGESAILEIAENLRTGKAITAIPGTCYIAKEPPDGYLELPSFEDVLQDKRAFITMFHQFYRNNDPETARGLYQRHDARYLVQNPPAPLLSTRDLDRLYDLDYEREVHPYYRKQGGVRALETIRFAITTHRGCFGECNFCAITVHQGRRIRSRSENSILKEAEKLSHHPGFKGYIHDVGGPTANMYGMDCRRAAGKGQCSGKRCLFPVACPSLHSDHGRQIALLKKLRGLPGIKKIFIASGIRYDLILNDPKHGEKYLHEIVGHHTSGQLKVAPEHADDRVLALMRKPKHAAMIQFKQLFDARTKATGKRHFLTYYLIAAHPGSTEADMQRTKAFVSAQLHINPEQVQIFTPTPSTYSTLMYYTEMDPFSGEKIFVEKNMGQKQAQKNILTKKYPRK